MHDKLEGFHIYGPPEREICAVVAQMISILEQKDSHKPEEVFHSVSSLLSESVSSQVLHLLCEKTHIDYLSLMQTTQGIALRHLSPKILLHFMLFPPIYLAQKLEIDPQIAVELLNELRRSFIIDEPLVWLKRLLSYIEKERAHYAQAKQDLLHGLAVVNQPVDTAEERKIRARKLKPILKPGPPGTT